ncbi:MAG: thiol peroxidase [Spirochaetia bacterium]|nr:thiol peroxidase [Spirochaetia bacterium]
MLVKMQGNPVTLIGNLPAVGSKVPEFTVTAADLSDFSGAGHNGVRVYISVPSIDTPVCDMEVRRFNQEAAALGNVSINVISMDLPFAQARWCGAAGIDAVKLFSDYKYRSFGEAFGVMIRELGLLARAVFIVDAQNIVRYVQVVEEVTSEPDYEAVLKALKTL